MSKAADASTDAGADEGYCACAEYEAGGPPEPLNAGEGRGLRIAFVCPERGARTVVVAFEVSR